MTETTNFDWRPFLLRWSEEWADSLTDDDVRNADDLAARRARWLGLPPATEEQIVALEQRLGRRLPPSYREFLKVTDGWRHAGGFVWLLAGTVDAHWHENESELAEIFAEGLDEDADHDQRYEVDIWHRGLQLDVESDVVYVLMDPEEVDEDGEWTVYTWASWRGDPPQPHGNFWDFMQDMYREFHSLRSGDGDEAAPEFANDTTRRLDDQVAAARLAALRGDWRQALEMLDEAKEYGRPRAAGLGDQIRRLLGETYRVSFDELAADARYASEVLPPLVADHAEHSYRDDSTLRFSLRGADEDLVSLAYATLEQVRNLTYRYTAAGPFGVAVERARALARQADTDGAWRTLRAALPQWQPLGPDHIVPLGWVADPLLGPLWTEERGRELLATPRGGQVGVAPPPTAGLDHEGLDWLAGCEPREEPASYRFVLVEGVTPDEMPGRLADGATQDAGAGGDSRASGGGVRGGRLSVPMNRKEAYRNARHNLQEFSSFADRALMAVGRAGSGWSFAFDSDPAGFHRPRFVSPAAAASAGTRAVVVWSGLRTQRSEEAFCHVSVATDGVEQYAFTYLAGEVHTSGEIPPALNPARFFGDPTRPTDPATGERTLLAALADEFGVTLPQHAIRYGRLPMLVSRSWTRPPRDGEVYLVVRQTHITDLAPLRAHLAVEDPANAEPADAHAVTPEIRPEGDA
ncbi:SMI1/KNR4 family protein [Streptomyces sp. 71268]|uniref:SMI1/KNR4 family protein n=1 Tax=Streptomyces sp. 71268 TaxID=3002640 RepID=UPI0023F93A2D|nr:SMI1/KNR4 family protein [Streptomyces sp. 71268]WEV28962.1 SMI1/KNR4 family protein [Streptomyces sp. 71268]